MTHRQRIVTALSHKEPDRTPTDLASTIDSSIVVEGYERLKESAEKVSPAGQYLLYLTILV
jgi:hypothetical protein